jgi:hypothetical protein
MRGNGVCKDGDAGLAKPRQPGSEGDTGRWGFSKKESAIRFSQHRGHARPYSSVKPPGRAGWSLATPMLMRFPLLPQYPTPHYRPRAIR